MARPSNANAELTRQRIISAASHLFAEYGRSGTSVRAIAQEAGVNSAMVSHYFGGKDGLYADCLADLYRELSEGQTLFMDALAAGGSMADVVSRTVRDAFAFARRKRGLIRLVMRHVLDQGEVDRDRQAELLIPFLDQGSQLLSEASSRGAAELRIALQSLVFLNVRYALCTAHELATITGDQTHYESAISEHLVSVALDTLGLTGERA